MRSLPLHANRGSFDSACDSHLRITCFAQDDNRRGGPCKFNIKINVKGGGQECPPHTFRIFPSRSLSTVPRCTFSVLPYLLLEGLLS
jgi:hypothetical protein